MVIIKGPYLNESGIIGNVVRQYTEETSASTISLVDESRAMDIKSLMANVSLAEKGQGGSEEDTYKSYTILSNSVQAIDTISTDYLDDLKPNKITEYTVQPGDNLSFIASDFGVSTSSVLWANSLASPDSIKPGQIIRIPPISGVIHKVKKGDTLSSIAKKYTGEVNKILTFNELASESALELGSEIVIPDGVMDSTATKTTAGASAVSKRFAYLPDLGDYFKTPTAGYNWGSLHGRNGVDVANACGTPIYSSADGVVDIAMISGWNGGFGSHIKLTHPNGTETLYAHLSKLFVSAGANVAKGDKIGLMGTTGHSTGCHLHFEVHGARNPLTKR
ncbi:MAG: peptidoglycan DD-metalloendopeptidase family protein [Patescibacteria group bacterium]